MHYLGISCVTHDTSACLIKNNEIIAFVEEERFNRIKHTTHFPVNSIKYCLEKGGVTLSDVKIGISYDPNLVLGGGILSKINPIETIPKIQFRNRIVDQSKKFKFYFGTDVKVNFLKHHDCHQFSSFPLSGFDESISISVDGYGENNSAVINHVAGGKVKLLKEVFLPHSLGNFYSYFTDWLGFEVNEGEGKTMGLAPYGKSVYNLSDSIKFSNGDFKLLTTPKMIEKRFGPRRLGEIQQIHKDVAASVQKSLEDALLHMTAFYNKSKNLCLSGGVALNCVANGKILESRHIDNIFIQPAANDAGTALGAAVMMASRDGHKFKKMEHIYYGPEFSNTQIKKILDLNKLEYEYVKNIEKTAAHLISEGKIVSWFQGRIEVGPRALGNRSILADPRDPKMKDKVNKLVKHRESWRPFCPSLLEHSMKDYFTIDYESPYMILALEVKEGMRKEIPSVVHVDGTARPQTVNERQNKTYFKLIKEFENVTGIPVLLNTSFNIKGEPIVCTPQDAVRCFFGTGLDALALGNYLIEKPVYNVCKNGF